MNKRTFWSLPWLFWMAQQPLSEFRICCCFFKCHTQERGGRERLRGIVTKWNGLLRKMIEESHCAEVLLTFPFYRRQPAISAFLLFLKCLIFSAMCSYAVLMSVIYNTFHGEPTQAWFTKEGMKTCLWDGMWILMQQNFLQMLYSCK